MSMSLKDRSFGTLFWIVIIGILIGSFLNTFIGMLPIGTNNVVKTFFTYNFINFGIGFPEAMILNLDAIKIQIGFQIKFSLLSLIGLAVSLYLFRWYR